MLLVVEIADSSKRYDIGRKAKLYASFGVRELWVVDAVRLTARVFRQPAAEGYRETRDCSADGADRPAICPGRLRVALGRP